MLEGDVLAGVVIVVVDWGGDFGGYYSGEAVEELADFVWLECVDLGFAGALDGDDVVGGLEAEVPGAVCVVGWVG